MNKKYVKIGESNGEIVFEEVEVTQEEILKEKREEQLKQEERRKKYPLPLSKEIRIEILRRCEILQYLGDCGIMSDFDDSTDEQLVEYYSWVLDDEHSDLAEPFNITI
tara:strand:- start:300 stop:623 length:324 start_codon:yes stop_codon:yes gene_type:complete